MQKHASPLDDILGILFSCCRESALLSRAKSWLPPASSTLEEANMTALSTVGNPVLYADAILAGIVPGGKKTCRFKYFVMVESEN